MLDLIIKNGECYIDGKINKTNIGIRNGKISIIGGGISGCIAAYELSCLGFSVSIYRPLGIQNRFSFRSSK